MNIVIVESPAKAKTINKYLGSQYKVLASFGHVRDLPAKDGSVLPDQDFSMKWDVDSAASKRLNEIAKAVKEADSLILATDPDREGEAISWHILDILRQKKVLKDKPVKRVVFNAITKKSVLDAMNNPRDIDTSLVDAYLARRALDYLVGFTLSPVLWRKLPGARSAGRVQSVALRIICDRESEIEHFIKEDYWSITTDLKTIRNEGFQARLTMFNHKKIGKLDIQSQEQADQMRHMLESAKYHTLSVEAKHTKRNPFPPFTTSTLQQAASSKLGFSASRTMQIAQKLYEGVEINGEMAGLITYMRTDGVQIAPEAIDSARKVIHEFFGSDYVPEKPRFYSTKAKNTQEAHEAIRPTDFQRIPNQVRNFLDTDQVKLYELIWKRAIASQMRSAEIERTTVEIEAQQGENHANLRATGSVIRFDGFISVYTDQRDEENSEENEITHLPQINTGETLTKEKVEAIQHSTEPPPRYSEASLIKKLEELGIGRPSTYASTLATLSDRGYIIIDKRKLIPDVKGRIVTAFLENFFNRYVEYGFTADLEEKLDLISDGKLSWKDVLRNFWDGFNASITNIQELRITNVLDVLNITLAPLIFPGREDGNNVRSCPLCSSGQLSLKLGRYGAFVGCSNYPECKYTRQLGTDPGEEKEVMRNDEPVMLGIDPKTGKDVSLRNGRFGPYIQVGEQKEAKRVRLPKEWQTEKMTLDKALALISLPREIGIHPETGKIITATIGRYGPYLAHDGKYAPLLHADEIFDIGINRAVTVLAEKQENKTKRNRTKTAALATLGDHPDGGTVTIRNGRYGPYVNWGKINATLPKDKDPISVKLSEALELISDKASSKKTTAKKASSKRKET
ncbi:type I DNA topoisomerase [Bartonella quintana]|uniref:DNA topoisomerase 1 n=3 Tax=Bartonella quintana TaxID=803 RepID=A0A0H3LU61_BARQU|nr:type I DNA topoisomerase [Bartonella quintana]ETS13066.1 DNA topoisomerase I [Bartonella quintana BQ2-D70]ETS14278.1 DNA topoisomerase I [Bartonella quintana JK 73rel]ETS15965.1 DNA topoisomerase I [Bartonella quintana JK 73]ETS17968.1 DNA topoisomerase I [Bartonella quintana JK 7]ETS18797.1 DNA topoisomerase I [Bartonella quintana JK 12]